MVEDVETVEVALGILHAIAEDPYVRSSHRLAARRHLRKLQQAAQESPGAASRRCGDRLMASIGSVKSGPAVETLLHP
jgi:hypothetical protein